MKNAEKIITKNVESLLEEKYLVTLPIYAIKLLLKYITTTANHDLYYRQAEFSSPQEVLMFRKTHQEITYLIAEELKKHDLDWKSIFQEVMSLTKEQKELTDIPF